MPSRRRTRRAPRPVRRRSSRNRSARSRKKLRKPQKPRLVRRYLKGKQRPKHPGASNLRESGQLTKSSKNVAQNADAKPPGPIDHNAVPKPPPNPPAPVNPGVVGAPNPAPAGNGAPPPPPPPRITGSPLLGDITYSPTSAPAPVPPTAPAGPLAPKQMSFSPLPPLPSLVNALTSPSSAKTIAYGTPSHLLPVETSPPIINAPANDVQTPAATKEHSISLAVIILLAVGSGLLMLGLCILLKMCTRPRRKDRPKPSLPIFKDVEPEEDFYETESKRDSPLFGGKERFSPMPGTVGVPVWNWVPYPHQRLTQVAQPPTQNNSVYANSNISGVTLPSVHTQSISSSEASIPQPKPPPVAPAISQRTIKRQSAASLSPYSPRLYANIGQAITTQDPPQTSFTGDGHDVLKQSKNKASVKRRSQIAREERAKNRESSVSDAGLAYDGTDIGSPSALEYMVDKTPVPSSYEGRERIRSGYFAAGAYPRISTAPGTSYSIATATRVNVGQRSSFIRDKFASPPLQRSNSKRQRDTQALTYALGLATPETKYLAQPSPQPTLYPDDSMSIVESKRPKKRKPTDSAPDVPVIFPEDSQRRRSSGLMGMDFGVGQMSISGLDMSEDDGDRESIVQDRGTEISLGPYGHEADMESPVQQQQTHQRSNPQVGNKASSSNSSSADRPPRVPSPPPMPSLSQMALAQHNPEAYANYRSPTYSLYGLYEDSGNRKSVAR